MKKKSLKIFGVSKIFFALKVCRVEKSLATTDLAIRSQHIKTKYFTVLFISVKYF